MCVCPPSPPPAEEAGVKHYASITKRNMPPTTRAQIPSARPTRPSRRPVVVGLVFQSFDSPRRAVGKKCVAWFGVGGAWTSSQKPHAAHRFPFLLASSSIKMPSSSEQATWALDQIVRRLLWGWKTIDGDGKSCAQQGCVGLIDWIRKHPHINRNSGHPPTPPLAAASSKSR